jgi:hypothetical protein
VIDRDAALFERRRSTDDAAVAQNRIHNGAIVLNDAIRHHNRARNLALVADFAIGANDGALRGAARAKLITSKIISSSSSSTRKED